MWLPGCGTSGLEGCDDGLPSLEPKGNQTPLVVLSAEERKSQIKTALVHPHCVEEIVNISSSSLSPPSPPWSPWSTTFSLASGITKGVSEYHPGEQLKQFCS
ncbi:hypothetical protein P7K49_018307 [Saguinus oedipus]|uniref:Uncharacterized protein n=1 Tax=Saguinus oedipus TaxID=9490 RepID=A0ABQ9V5R7_SAGOE|nr:hypothetical protein P7K49_018307 [Saguinus oedipus]